MPTPPRVRWTFHGTAAVRSYDGALAWLSRICGCRALEYTDDIYSGSLGVFTDGTDQTVHNHVCFVKGGQLGQSLRARQDAHSRQRSPHALGLGLVGYTHGLWLTTPRPPNELL